MTNKQLRLSTAAILAASAVMTTALPANVAEAATYKDVPKSANYYDAVEALSAQKIITGYGDGTFKPNAKITRGQVAKILTRMLDLKPTTTMQFSDVAKDHDFYQYASAVVSAGLLSKDNGKFNSKGTLTRNEYAEILMKAFNLPETNVELPFLDVTSKYRSAIRAVYANGLMKGVSKTRFNGNGEVTRSHLVMTLHKAMELQGEKVPDAQLEKVSFTLAGVDTTSVISYGNMRYQTTPELQKLFRSSNANTLRDADIEAYVKNGKIVEITQLKLNRSWYGTHTLDGNGGSFSFPIIADSYNFTLKNMTVPKVIVGDDAYGTFNLENVTVKDRLIVEDGYSSSFNLNLKNSPVNYMEVKRDRTTIESNLKLPKVFAGGYAYDITLNTAVGQLQFERDGYFTLYGTGSLDTVNVPLESSLYINNRGSIKTLTIDDPETYISLNSYANIDKVVIPENAKYEDIFRYPNTLKNYVSKIYYPNSTKNLLSNQVYKPSKEEVAFNKALENVIRTHDHSLTGTTLTIRTNFNEILPKMKEVSFDQVIYLSGPAPNDPYIPFAYFKDGNFDTLSSFNTLALQNGISLQRTLGRANTLGGFNSYGSESIILRFDTDREIKIRTTVFVNNRAKNTQETTLNPGNSNRLTDAINASLDSYSTSITANTLQTKIKTKSIQDMAKNIEIGQQIKLHTDIKHLEKIPVVIKKGQTELKKIDVLVSELKTGINLHTLIGTNIDKLANFKNDSETDYSIEFLTTEEMEFSSALIVDGKVHTEGAKKPINAGANAALDGLTPDYEVETADSKTVSFKYKALANIPDILKNAPLDIKFKATDAQIPTEKVKFNVEIDGEEGTAELTRAQLTAGVNILQFTQFDNTYTPILLKDLAADKDIKITLQTPMKAELEATAVINNREFASDSVRKVSVELQDDLVGPEKVGISSIAENTKVAAEFAVDAYQNGITVKTKYAADITSSPHKDNDIDARLKVVEGINKSAPNETRFVSVYFEGHLVKSFASVTNKELTDGVLLSKILGQTSREKVSSHAAEREDNWKIIVHGNEAIMDIDVDLIAIDAEKKETILASASNIINKQKLEEMVKTFTLQKADKRYTLEAEFTSNENVAAGWQTSFIIAPKSTVGEEDTASIKVTRYNNTTAIPYSKEITLKGADFEKGINTSSLVFTGQSTDYKYLSKLKNAKWQFDFKETAPAMQAYFTVNDQVIKTVDETAVTP